MEANGTSRAPPDFRPSSGFTSQESTPTQPPPIRPLIRTDSRSALPQTPRPQTPQTQARPQFQPGGPVTTPPFVQRTNSPVPRGPVPTFGPPGPQQTRPPPQRPLAPQSIAPQQGPRPVQAPTAQLVQRAPPPNNLQFGPRQPQAGAVTTPTDVGRPQIPQQPNGTGRNGPAPSLGQVSRQPSQGSLRGLEVSNTLQTKLANLDYQSIPSDKQNVINTENGLEAQAMAKGRSYSIAAAPGAPSPLKVEDDRRKSVSAIGGRLDEFTIRSPGLGLIQEGKLDSKENVVGSRESVRSEKSNEGAKDIPDRPESRLSGSKMTESFIGTLPSSTPKKKIDDDDDVISQNVYGTKPINENFRSKEELLDRSPSLSRSDDSPEPKHRPVQSPLVPNKSQNATPEPQRPKTPKIENKPDVYQDYKPVGTPNKMPVRSPQPENKPPPVPVQKKPNELTTMNIPDSKKSTPRKTASAPRSRPKDGDNDSGVDESMQGNDVNGSPGSPNKKLPSKLPMKEKSSNSIKTSLSRSSSKSATAKTPENPPPVDKKKVPMNKIQVGNAPSPNIKAVKSKIGSLDNATYKPGGGKVKIENRKLEFNAGPKIAAKNDAYTPSGGAKKIITTKLEWNAKSKIGSLQNTAYKPGGGDKKIETVKLDFKDKAKPKVASTVNITHKPGGGTVKIENQKLEFKAQSKVGSMDNVKHRPGGGDIKIFDDKEYIKQMAGQSPLPESHNHSRQESPLPPTSAPPKSDENLNQQQC